MLPKYRNRKWKKKEMIPLKSTNKTFPDMGEGKKTDKQLEKERRWATKFW